MNAEHMHKIADRLFDELAEEESDQQAMMYDFGKQPPVSNPEGFPHQNYPRSSHSTDAKIANIQAKFQGNVVKGESKIEYVPFERKVVEYQNQKRVEKVPKKRVITEFREQKVVDVVPREVVKKDYYAVEYIRHYIPKQVEQKKTVMVPKQVIKKKIEYVPVTRQVVHGQNKFNDFSTHYGYSNTQYADISQSGSIMGGMNMNMFQGLDQRHSHTFHNIRNSRKAEKRVRKHSDLYESYVSDSYA